MRSKREYDVFREFSEYEKRILCLNLSEESEKKVLHMDVLVEEEMDQVFRAMAESTEEAVLNSMLEAESVTSGDGKTIRHSLKEWMK